MVQVIHLPIEHRNPCGTGHIIAYPYRSGKVEVEVLSGSPDANLRWH